jgi:hypothetical protein
MGRARALLVAATLAVAVALIPVPASAQTTTTVPPPTTNITTTISPATTTVQVGGTVELTATFTLVSSADDPPQAIDLGIHSPSAIIGITVPQEWTVTPDVTGCSYVEDPHFAGCVWQPAAVGATAVVQFGWFGAPEDTPVGYQAQVCANADPFPQVCSTITAIAPPSPPGIVLPAPVEVAPLFTG